METAEIRKSNKMIAVFMANRNPELVGINGKYHESWDWLMPVICKLGTITFLMDKEDIPVKSYEKLKDAMFKNEISLAHEAVIELIKWDNHLEMEADRLIDEEAQRNPDL